jgi:hypothetical protein
MRTTLTIDDDVAVMLDRLQKAKRLSLKAAINQVLRVGLQQLKSKPAERPRFETKILSSSPCLLDNVDNTAEVLAIAEGEAYKGF